MPDQLVLMITSMSKSLIIVIVGAVLFFAYLMHDAKKISYSRSTHGISGVFFNLSLIDKLRLALEFLKLLYVIACLVEFEQFDLVHLVFFFVIIAFSFIVNLFSLSGLGSLVYSVVTFASLFLINALQGYRNQMYSKTGFTIIIVATSIFISLFAYYQFVANINSILIRKEKRNVQKANA